MSKEVEKMRTITVFEFMENPRSIQIPEELIREFEKVVDSFTGMRASALLSSEGCSEDAYMDYTDEKLSELLIKGMKDEINEVPAIRMGVEEYVAAGMPESFESKVLKNFHSISEE